MVEIAVKYLESTTGARLAAGDPDRMCRGVTIDSRAVEPDAIFVAFPGERVDGNDFALKAIELGAGAVVMTRDPEDEVVAMARERGCAVLTCDDPTEFLLRLAQGYRARLRCTVIGVTGSIGKTTTKDVLAACLSKRYRVHATAGNYNNLIGLPLTILSAPADTQVLVLEMGMNDFGEISRLTACAQPTFGIITKVGTSHIGMLGSREGIARAKAEIVEGMPPSAENFEGHHSALVLHGEDDFTPYIIERYARPAGIDVVLAGTSTDDDVCATHIELDEDGRAHFDITFEDGSSFKTHLSIPGAQSVPNALFAAAVAHRLGVPAFEIDEAFASLEMTGRRAQVRHAGGGHVLKLADRLVPLPEGGDGLRGPLRRKAAEFREGVLQGRADEFDEGALRRHRLPQLVKGIPQAVEDALLGVCQRAVQIKENIVIHTLLPLFFAGEILSCFALLRKRGAALFPM